MGKGKRKYKEIDGDTSRYICRLFVRRMLLIDSIIVEKEENILIVTML